MATIFKLIIEDDEGKTTVYPLADGRLTIGRKDGNTIRLMERNVSRRHARLERTNGAVFIEDLDSYNGVKINGERISGKYEVKEGDLVEIGDYHLALQKSVTRSEAPEPAGDGGGFDDAGEGTWPQPGTVPDFQLPDELLIEAREDVAVRDTVIDQPVPPQVPEAVNQTVDERPKPVPVGAGPQSGLQMLSAADAAPETIPPGASFAAAEEDEPDRTPTDLRPGPDVVSDVPRLICVSTTYAGRAFALTRPELIIGRVEDNDIVIEHRSVSRNHAKILFDGRTHKIIDLQSANGILVNGEEYAMTDLRKGDLIELGHVRFRFVTADEPFRATAEERQQMLSAGVRPPLSAEEDPDEPLDGRQTEPPTYDPSQAATVTDAPLSALETSPPEPMVEASALKTAPHPQPTGANGAPKTGSGPQVTARSQRTTENDRPTELPRPQAGAGAMVVPGTEPRVPMARPASLDEDPPLLRSRKKRTLPMVAAVALLAVSVFAAVVLLFDSLKGDDSADRALQDLVEDKRYKDAAAHCDDNQGRFVDPAEAQRLCSAARNFLRAAAVAADPIEPFPEPEIEPPVAPALEPVEATANTDSVPEPEIEEPPSLAPPPPPPPPAQPSAAVLARRRRAAARRAAARKAASIRTLVERGKRLLINGDFAEAEKTLRECLRLEPNQPDCHRNLGVLYAQQDQTASAIRHYRRYVELRPDAGDADRVREILRKFEGSQ